MMENSSFSTSRMSFCCTKLTCNAQEEEEEEYRREEEREQLTSLEEGPEPPL